MLIWPGAGGLRSAQVAADAQRAAWDAESEATRARNQVEVLEQRLDRLALVTEALWSLLQERVGIKEIDLLDRMREVDMTDGALDGRVRHSATPCPSCRRMVAARNVRCIYCGAQVPRSPLAT